MASDDIGGVLGDDATAGSPDMDAREESLLVLMDSRLFFDSSSAIRAAVAATGSPFSAHSAIEEAPGRFSLARVAGSKSCGIAGGACSRGVVSAAGLELSPTRPTDTAEDGRRELVDGSLDNGTLFIVPEEDTASSFFPFKDATNGDRRPSSLRRGDILVSRMVSAVSTVPHSPPPADTLLVPGDFMNPRCGVVPVVDVNEDAETLRDEGCR